VGIKAVNQKILVKLAIFERLWTPSVANLGTYEDN